VAIEALLDCHERSAQQLHPPVRHLERSGAFEQPEPGCNLGVKRISLAPARHLQVSCVKPKDPAGVPQPSHIPKKP
jgi:hypothetical protein